MLVPTGDEITLCLHKRGLLNDTIIDKNDDAMIRRPLHEIR